MASAYFSTARENSGILNRRLPSRNASRAAARTSCGTPLFHGMFSSPAMLGASAGWAWSRAGTALRPASIAQQVSSLASFTCNPRRRAAPCRSAAGIMDGHVRDDLDAAGLFLELLDPPSLLVEQRLDPLLRAPGVIGGGLRGGGELVPLVPAAPLLAVGFLRAQPGDLGVLPRLLGRLLRPLGVVDRGDQVRVLGRQVVARRDRLLALGVGGSLGSLRRLLGGLGQGELLRDALRLGGRLLLGRADRVQRDAGGDHEQRQEPHRADERQALAARRLDRQREHGVQVGALQVGQLA